MSTFLRTLFHKLRLLPQQDHPNVEHGGGIHSISSRLPNGLIHHILEMALVSDSSGLSLSLVSTWTRSLALPYLYSTEFINDDTQPLVVDSITLNFTWNLSYSEVRKRMVRNLWCSRRKDSVAIIIEFMRAYPRIVSLSISGVDFCMILVKGPSITFTDLDDDITNVAFFNRSLESIFGGMTCTPREIHFHPDSNKPRFLSIMPLMTVDRDWTTFATAFLSEITHVMLPPLNYYLHLDRFAKRLPHLTHLAVPFTSANVDQLSILRDISYVPTMQMLVLAIAMDNHTRHTHGLANAWVRESRHHTSKIFLLPYESDVDAARIQWEEDVRGGGSIWQRAVQYTMAWEMTGEIV